MQDQYKITQIALLYGLSTDTLRYYEEQGLLHPTRDPHNGYRLYGIQDICTLNVIRDLRQLGLSTAKIGQYLQNRRVDSTLDLLHQEDEMISRQISRLTRARAQVRQQAKDLQQNLRQPVGVPQLEQLPARPCFLLKEDVILEQEIDFVLKKLEKRHEDVLHSIGTRQIGAALDGKMLKQGVYNHYSSVFFLGADPHHCDSTLPEGLYASMFYAGEYGQAAWVLRELTDFLAQKGLEPAAPPLELYPIDAHHTLDHSEYLTEVQVLTRPLQPAE